MVTLVFLFVCVSSICACCFAKATNGSLCTAKDYSGCPRGWERFGKWSCAAPVSYVGPCMKDYEGLAKLDEGSKQRLEGRCNIEWPCEVQCERDWSVACPEFWVETVSGYCIAPPQYRFEGCAKMLPAGASITERQSIAAVCHVKWPCTSRCEKDYAQACPTGWLQNIDASCQVAKRRERVGPCEPVVIFANSSMTNAVEGKKTFAAKCGVEFCAQEETLQSAASNSAELCPHGWIPVGEIALHCVGLAYTGPCRPVVAMQDLLDIGHAAFGKTCNTEWVSPPRGVEALIQQAKTPLLSGPLLPSGLILGL